MNILQQSWQKMLAGGVYMFPLFLVGCVMFLLILYCVYTHRALGRSFRILRNGAESSLKDDSELARMLEEYRASRCPDPELNFRLREELGHCFLSRLGAGGRAVLLCASIAMLLGLLGTVSGMINAFEAIQTFGVGNTKSFAAGISEALLTTQSGLLVGVTGVVVGQFIKRRSKRLEFKLYRYFEQLEAKMENQTGGGSYGA